jgi:hypothetical protein|tara:strand:+ start:516 stop:2084 length:1569 start_codon:yes stop_codon:yes gene_type:complete
MNSKIFSLVPTNGTEFTGKLGQKIIFEVEPSVGLLKARESYLVLNVLNTSSDWQRTMVNNMAGVSSIISRVDIYSLKSGQHLETMENYDLWSAVEHQYLYQDKTNLRAMEGVGAECYAHNALANTTNVAEVQLNPKDIESNLLSPVQSNGNAKYNFRQFITPLKCGIMRYWDDEKLVPLINLLGLRIEITLQDPKICLQHLPARTVNGGAETLRTLASTVVHTADGSGGGLPCANNNGTDLFITTTDDCNVLDCGLAVGNSITIMSAEAAAGVARTITALEADGSKVKITFDGANLGGARTQVLARRTADNRAYQVKPEFRVVSVQPPAGEVQSLVRGIDYQFTTYDLFFNTIPQNVRKHQIEVPSVATKAQCLMTFFHKTADEQFQDNSEYYTCLIPDEIHLDSVQYHIDGRLIPVRAYNPKHKAEKIISQHETAKALTTINREPQDLGNSDGRNLEQYTNTYMIARELARPPYVYPLAEAEPQIRLGFSQNTASSLTARTLVWSKKVVRADPTEGIKVFH